MFMMVIFMNRILTAAGRLCNDAFASITSIVEELKSDGISPVKIVAGGTPTFPIHAANKNVETSPGTILLWDWGYSSSFADLNFSHAAVLLDKNNKFSGKRFVMH